jgi:crossover junction endodeoxyribonuclease RuvC
MAGNTFTIGIDPGKAGAVALVGPAGLLGIWDTPTIKVGNKSQYDTAAMVRIIHDAEQVVGAAEIDRLTAAIEQVHAMPGQGVTSMFAFGEGFGIWKGIIAAYQIPVVYPTPQAWKKRMLEGMPKDKGSSRLRAKQLWPTVNFFDRVKDDGRAEAALIASYARGRA